MPEFKEPILNYWYRALHSHMGVEINCSDTELARRRLYAVRHEAKDSDLEKISVCSSPLDPTRLWLVKQKPSNEPT